MVKVLVGPAQVTDPFSNEGVTTMVATTGVRPPLSGTNGGIFPLPEAGSPIDGVLLVQA